MMPAGTAPALEVVLTVLGSVPVIINVRVATFPVFIFDVVSPPLTFTPPLTSNATDGLDVPIPTLEPLGIYTLVPLVFHIEGTFVSPAPLPTNCKADTLLLHVILLVHSIFPVIVDNDISGTYVSGGLFFMNDWAV